MSTENTDDDEGLLQLCCIFQNLLRLAFYFHLSLVCGISAMELQGVFFLEKEEMVMFAPKVFLFFLFTLRGREQWEEAWDLL